MERRAMCTRVGGWLMLLGLGTGLAITVISAQTPGSVALTVALPDEPTAGARLFVQKGCVRCHALGGDEVGMGPDLGRIHFPGTALDLAGSFWNHAPVMAEKMRESKIQQPTLDSREMADQMIRLDASLGSFLSDAERIVGRGNIVVALSADHAVMPLPEHTMNVKHGFARRILPQTAINPGIEALDRTLEQELGTGEYVIQSDAFLNYAAAMKAGIDSVKLEGRVKEGLLKLDGIADVYFRRELRDNSTPDRPFLEMVRRGYFPGRGKDFLIRFCDNCLISTSKTGTSHGSPYNYDTHVPLVFWGTGVKSESVDRDVHTVDIAPTLAKILGLQCPNYVDGHPLDEVAR